MRSSALVGREKELAIVRTCVQRLRRGEGGVVGLIGEPGLGKSLLLEAHLTEASDLTWLEGRALSFGQTLTYGPFIEALRGISGIHEHDTRDECWQKVESLIRGLFGRDGDKLVPMSGC